MRTRDLILGVIALVALSAGAGGAVGAQPPQGALDAIFSTLPKSGPGCAAGAERDGVTLFAKGWGSRDLTSHSPITPTSRFYMASVSKQVAALTVMEVIRSGKMSLDAPITRYIPELPAYLNAVTVYDLLTHMSGVRDYFALGELEGTAPDHVFTEAEVIDAVSRQRALNFEPGTEFLYSNSGYVLLAVAAERVTGRPLNETARAALFAPLGMQASFFQHHHDAPVPQKAHGYSQGEAGPRLDDSHLDVVGDGGLYSTVNDMLRWLHNLDTGAVGAASLKSMQVPAKTRDGKLTGYGMGLEVGELKGLKVVEHGGALAGYRTDDLWIPSEKLGVVVLCNFAEARPGDFAHRIAALYVPALAETPPATAARPLGPPASPTALQAFAGRYRADDGTRFKLEVKSGRLILAEAKLPLAPVGPGRFSLSADGSGPLIIFDDPSAPSRFEMRMGARPPRFFARTRAEPPTEALTASLIGDYESPELRAAYHIRRGPAGLTVAIGGRPAQSLDPVGEDQFVVDGLGAELKLQRDAAGKIEGFTVSFGRVKGIVLRKV